MPLVGSLTLHGLVLFILSPEMPLASIGVPSRVLTAQLHARTIALTPHADTAPIQPLTESRLTHRGRFPSPVRREGVLNKKAPEPEVSAHLSGLTGSVLQHQPDATASEAASNDFEAEAGGEHGVDRAEELRGYRIAIAASARRFRRYPAIARERGWEGYVGIEIVVAPSGLPEVHLARSSGYAALDEQALEMMRQAAGFAPVPAALQISGVRLELPVQFRLDE